MIQSSQVVIVWGKLNGQVALMALVIILLGKNPLKTGAYIAVNLHLHESMCHQRHF